MLTILLVVVGIAYFISVSRGRLTAAGTELLAQVRAGTLAKHWPGQGRHDYFLTTIATGQAVGWMINSRVITDDGYGGASTIAQLRQGAPGLAHESEQWLLSSDASKGKYRSTNGGNEIIGIDLSDGQVKVAYRVSDPRLRVPVVKQASSPAPPNYIPEGLLDLMVCQVAKTGRHAMFRMILNDQAIQGNEVIFVPVECKPVGSKAVEVRLSGAQGASARTYTFDDAWELLKIEDESGLVTKRATLADLKTAFGHDELLQRLSPATETSPETAPETTPMPSPADDGEPAGPVEIT
jgi:hypothetical protein